VECYKFYIFYNVMKSVFFIENKITKNKCGQISNFRMSLIYGRVFNICKFKNNTKFMIRIDCGHDKMSARIDESEIKDLLFCDKVYFQITHNLGCKYDISNFIGAIIFINSQIPKCHTGKWTSTTVSTVYIASCNGYE